MNFIPYRYAAAEDCELILSFIKELSVYEKMENQVTNTPEMIRHWLFEEQKAQVIFAMEDGKEVGFALFFTNYSTFLGKPGIYLEDLFVKPEYRGKGYGKGLMQVLAQIAVERGYGRMDWWCLDWNKPSIAFYKSLGAVPMEEWTTYRLQEDTLRKTAEGK